MNDLPFNEFRKKLFSRLDKKTGWGKEELKKEFDATLLEFFEERQVKQ